MWSQANRSKSSIRSPSAAPSIKAMVRKKKTGVTKLALELYPAKRYGYREQLSDQGKNIHRMRWPRYPQSATQPPTTTQTALQTKIPPPPKKKKGRDCTGWMKLIVTSAVWVKPATYY